MKSLGAWFRGIRGRLLILIILPVVAMSLIAFFGLRSVGHLHGNTKMITEDRMPKITTLLRLRINGEAAVRFLWASLGYDEANIRTEKTENSKKKFASFETEYSQFMALHPSEKVKTDMESMKQDWDKVGKFAEEFIGLAVKNQPDSDKVAKDIMEAKLIPLYLKQIEIIGKIEKDIQAQVDQSKIDGDHEANQTRTMMMLMGAAATLLLFVTGFFIAHSLAKALSSLSGQVSESGSQVNGASDQLSTASQALSSGAAESASSMEETVSSLEELSSIVKMNADNAKQAASLAMQSTKSAETGESEIKKLISAMSDITASSKKIEEIINVIDDIAFQTNLLALNAAVEAARAGEQGKGFAVVAEAVRNLAQRSASAAKDINTLIKDAVSKTNHGATIADQSGSVLNEIVSSVKKVSDLNGEIASASAEQATAISQISKAMNELDTATQRNAATAEEVAASSEELSAQANSLQSLVGDLNVIIEGNSEAVGPKNVTKKQDSKAESPQKLQLIKGGNTEPKVKSSQLTSAQNAIPFDEDEPANVKRVGNLDGF